MAAATTTFPAGIPLGTKLNPPAGARSRVARPALVERLVKPEPRRLTLVDAPAGWGKTTILSEWASDSREERQFAWFTIDRGDNDPVRFWAYAIEALRRVAPSVGSASLNALGVSGTNPVEIVLPPLINELAALDERLVLVLEDYHLIQDSAVHEGVAFLLEYQPPTLELAIATRLDPPLPLARLRARGELVELRAAELRFTGPEAGELLHATLGDRLLEEDVARLLVRTEGWAAGLYLAALSVAGRDDASAFIEAFAGDDRHIVDYLGGEVLDGLDAETREFLLRTSILERVSGSLCDHVLDSEGSARRLVEIERANLFLVPLDDRREWFRYHHLFGDLLRHELERSEPEHLARLHRRAGEWLGASGAVDEAVPHFLAAGDDVEAARLVAEQWRGPFNRGELATVDRWLDELPERIVERDPDLRLARAWVAMDSGRPRDGERWLASAGEDVTSEALVLHAVLCFKLGKLGHAEEIARQATEVAPRDAPLGLPVARCILGIARYFRGSFEDAAASLQEAARLAAAGDNRLARIYALGYLALARLDQGDVEGARAPVGEALDLAGAPAAAEHFVTALALLARGRLDSDEETLEQAAALARRGAAPLEIGVALLGLGERRRDPATLAEARAALDGCEEVGLLPEWIAEAELRLRGRTPGPKRRIAGDLSDRELAVLRLLPSSSSLREIASSLYLSLNTVKTHTKSIYRKLDASSREEAVERGRTLGLL
jgi:LuxR family maltose regulon positive regulatory protein